MSAMTDGEALRLAVGIVFVLWCAGWVLHVGFIIDQWQWWRRTGRGAVCRSEKPWVTEYIAPPLHPPDTPNARMLMVTEALLSTVETCPHNPPEEHCYDQRCVSMDACRLGRRGRWPL